MPVKVLQEVTVCNFNKIIFLNLLFHGDTLYFRLSPLLKHVGKVVGDFGKKSCVSTGVTDRHDMTIAFNVALNPNKTSQIMERLRTFLMTPVHLND